MEEMALMCQGTEERGQILWVHGAAGANLTQASVDEKLLPSCSIGVVSFWNWQLLWDCISTCWALASSVQRSLFCSAPPDF